MRRRATLLALLIPALVIATLGARAFDDAQARDLQVPGTTAPAKKAAAKKGGGVDAGRARVEAGVAKLYDRSFLHQIQIEIAPADARNILQRTDVRVPATFTFDGVTLKNIGVRQSGGIYMPYLPIEGKPSLSVKFDEFVPNQKLYDLDKLIIKNERQDVSFLSEHITYEIFRRAGLAAPLTAHARVVINGIDLGLYLLREPIDKSFLTRNFGSDAKQGNLYEIENMREFVGSPTVPKLEDEGQNGRNREDIIAFSSAIASAVPARFVSTLSPLVDIDRLVTFIAAEYATDHWDGITGRNNNTYMYALPTDGGRFVFIPWGADQALGFSRPGFLTMNQPMSYLVNRMLAVPELRARVEAERDRIRQEPVWNKALLLERINQVAKIIEAAGIGSGRTPEDFARFKSYRGTVEGIVRQGQ
jgi:hypothetical protein